ncbi:MAG: hypothetical protein OXE48_05710 [Gammaproteobacteria bacterium]|nr:hypothetical protein [Gammaproteobacteria bacterium]
MKKLLKAAVVAGIAVFTLAVAGFGVFQYMNRTPPQLAEPNYFSYYKAQDTRPEGRVGVFISHLIQPEELRFEDYYVLAQKSFQYIPWPIRNMVRADRGVVLMDAERYYEFEEFKPARLIDHMGRDTDFDGVPYAQKYLTGEVVWSPPSTGTYMAQGYFLLPGRKAGMSTSVARLITKCRVFYYAPGKGFMDGRIPHEAGNRIIADDAMRKVHGKYGDIPWAWVTAEHFGMARRAMYDLLETGVDTVLLAVPRPIYSHHEEFNSSIKHAMHYIHDWEKENGKQIKVIITPPLGDQAVIRDAYLAMLKDRLDTFPAASAVKVVVSTHGMPWDQVPHEAWLELGPPYLRAVEKDLGELLEGYGFARHQLVMSQENFADPLNDPDNNYLSTNEAYWDGIRDGFDYVVNVPVSFFAENTDTAFGHAMVSFEGFDEYSRYDPIDYPDWNEPLVREYVQDGTRVIYNGTPVGRYRGPIVEAFFQAMDSVLSQHAGNPAAGAGAEASNLAFSEPFTGQPMPVERRGPPAPPNDEDEASAFAPRLPELPDPYRAGIGAQ